MKLSHWLHKLLSSKRPQSTRGMRRSRRDQAQLAAVEALEPRIVLSANVTSVSDGDVGFSTDDVNLWNNQSVISKNFNYSIGDSFAASVGGFEAGTGAKVKLEGGLNLGFQGFFNIGGATADVDYLTDISISTAGVGAADINNLVAGDHFTVSASQAPDSDGIALSTEISGIGAGLDFHFGLQAQASLKGKIAGKTVVNEGFGLDVDETVQIIRANFDGVTDKLDLSFFGETIPELSSNTVEVEALYADASLYVPELDTGVPGDGFDDSGWDGGVIENSQLPVNRSQGQTRIDFFRLGIDVAEALAAQAYLPTDFEFGNDNIGVEGIWISGKVEAYLGVAQEMTFTPQVMVDLNFLDDFGQPTQALVETSPGSGVFQSVTTKRINLGDNVEIIHSGGELNIDTDYVLTGSFHNKTNLYLSPAITVEVLDAKLKSSVGNTSFTAYRESFALSNPIPIANMFDRTFDLDGFSEVDGSDLSLTASPPTTFAAIAATNHSTIVEGDSVTAAVTIFDPDAAADDSDVYEIVIDWQDGTTETLTLDNTGSLSAHATFDASTHVLNVSHDYQEDLATQPNKNFAPDSFTKTLSFEVTKQTPGSTNLGETHTGTVDLEVLNVPADINVDALELDNNGVARLTVSYHDRGVLDSHDVRIQWGDNTATRFQLTAPGTLSVGQTLNATSGIGVLTINSVDAVTGQVSFTVTGHTYADVADGVVEVALVDDERHTNSAFAQVPFGLDLTSFTLPGSVVENGDATLSAAFSAHGTMSSASTEFSRHDIVINWDDANDSQPSTFDLPKANTLQVGDEFISSTDGAVLTITGLTELNRDNMFDLEYDISVAFDVTHQYLDDGLVSGNGTASDFSNVVLEIFENGSSFERRGATATQAVEILNAAPTVTLVPFDEEIGNGGVAILEGTVADPGTFDAIVLNVDWGDGTVDTFSLNASPVGTQSFLIGHTYATEGDYDVTATVVDDDGGTGSATTPSTVVFTHPPVAQDDAVTVTEDDSVTFNVLADNGNGADGDAGGNLDSTLTIALTTPTLGTLTNHNDGTFTFDPNGQFESLAAGTSQVVTFDYQIEDVLGNTDTGTVTITVNGVNDTPRISSVNSVLDEDAGNYTLNMLVKGFARDVDAGDKVSISDVSLASGRPISFSYNASGIRFDASQFNDLSAGESEILVFNFALSDDSGAANSTLESQFRLRVYGLNDTPRITSNVASVVVNEGQTAGNTGSFEDDDLSDTVTVTASIGTVVTNANGTWNWSFDTTDGSDESQAVTITATDSAGAETSTTFDLNVNNVAPTIALSGPTEVNEGTPYELTLGAVTDPGDDSVARYVVHWGDGTSDEYTTAGVQTHTYADGDTALLITVDLIDEDGTHFNAGGKSVIINNVAPTIDSLTSSATFAGKALPGETVTVTGSFSDVGLPDTHTVRIEWGDGTVTNTTGADLQIDQVNNTFVATHTYATGGIFAVGVTLTDNSGGRVSGTTEAVVAGVQLAPSGELLILGTDRRDHIHVSKHQGRIRVETKLHGQPWQTQEFDYADVQSIRILACGGNDHISVSHRIDLPATIDGGAGHDVITGGGGNNVILGGSGNDWISGQGGNDFIRGGDGNDVIFGGSGNDIVLGEAGNDWIFGNGGRDLLIGGTGSDVISGGRGDDVLIHASTNLDDDAAALHAVLADWTSSDSYSDRADDVQSLMTVEDDDETDILVGDRGRDLFFAAFDDFAIRSWYEEVVRP